MWGFKFRPGIVGAVAMMCLASPAVGAKDGPSAGKYDDPHFCSGWLAQHGDSSLSPAALRRCVVAIASTYIDAEENSIPVDQQLVADDISRHMIGKEPDFRSGNGRKIIADMSHDVIAAIKNRRWTVDGNQAWILYDGYLKTDPSKPGFFVAERLTIEKGLIKEILVAAIARPQ